MISVDGRSTGMEIKQFQNLEEILLSIMETNELEGRVVTDVFVNNESFSEIYPHQAEDIEADEIESVEVRSMPVADMALEITREMSKVVQLMDHGARRVAELFRQADDAEALEMLQDLLEVTREFLGMVGLLRYEYVTPGTDSIEDRIETISSLLGEMIEVLENEDWILLADLLEYEFLPTVKDWEGVIGMLRKVIPQ